MILYSQDAATYGTLRPLTIGVSGRGATRLPKVPRIVVIEDDASYREALRNLISLLGYSVEAFCSAKAFLESDTIHLTSCVITDVQMPGMTGVELQRRLLVAGHKTPIIFLTAYPEETIRARVILDGAIDYLSKPLGEERLLVSLGRALEVSH